MGNTHSHSQSPPSGSRKKRVVEKKVSEAFTRHVTLGCTSEHSNDTLSGSETNIQGMKERRVSEADILQQPFPVQVNYPLPQPLPSGVDDVNEDRAYKAFLKDYPEYQLTWIVDSLRQTDYTRLQRAKEIYVDYMGGALFPESLVKMHSEFLTDSILGNTHSSSKSSKLSLQYADEARAAVLTHFRASAEYTVVFTSNASGALKLIAESFPFAAGSSLVMGVDSHNSVHGIREYASAKGARTLYVPSTARGGVDIDTAEKILYENRPLSSAAAPSLYVLTALSNITNSKTPLSLATYASKNGYFTLVDAAALAATSIVNISEHAVDAMAISFYKMFGYPTGVGALIVKKSFLARLKRPWFAGGTVDIVQVPGTIFTRSLQLHEQFEDGTISYSQLPAITNGLRFAAAYLPFLPMRLISLLIYLTSSMSKIRHSSGHPVCQIVSKIPTRALRSVGDQADAGFILSSIFFDAEGERLPNSFIEFAASKHNISLRTGCMCNTGGAAAILGSEDEMANFYPGVTHADYEEKTGRELGVVRISLGIASNFGDVWRVIEFVASIGDNKSLDVMWSDWKESTTR